MDIKRVGGDDVKFKLQSDVLHPAPLLRYYKFSFGVDHFLSLDQVNSKKKKKKKRDKVAPDVEIKSVAAASRRQSPNIISPPPV